MKVIKKQLEEMKDYIELSLEEITKEIDASSKELEKEGIKEKNKLKLETKLEILNNLKELKEKSINPVEMVFAKRVEDLNNEVLKEKAESINFKKRLNDERINERKYSSMGVISSLMDVLDNFDKAVNMKTEDPTLKNFLIGFNMINTQINGILENEGVKYIETTNKEFNPKFHHSIETDYDESIEEGIILEELSKGYMYKDRVLKPSMVKVNKKGEK